MTRYLITDSNSTPTWLKSFLSDAIAVYMDHHSLEYPPMFLHRPEDKSVIEWDVAVKLINTSINSFSDGKDFGIEFPKYVHEEMILRYS